MSSSITHKLMQWKKPREKPRHRRERAKDISLISFNSYCRKVRQLSQRALRHLRSLADPDLGNQGIIDVSGSSRGSLRVPRLVLQALPDAGLRPAGFFTIALSYHMKRYAGSRCWV